MQTVFNTIRNRIQHGKGRIRTMKADYLLYALMDTIVDTYFEILEHIGEEIDTIEEDILTNPTKTTLQTLQTLKRDMISLRKSISPLREVVNKLERGEMPYIETSNEWVNIAQQILPLVKGYLQSRGVTNIEQPSPIMYPEQNFNAEMQQELAKLEDKQDERINTGVEGVSANTDKTVDRDIKRVEEEVKQ